MDYKVPFNKAFVIGEEIENIIDAIKTGHISGDGIYTKRCHSFFNERYKFKLPLLTTSCTDALEMCAILIDLKLGDEVIVPSYSFVTSALPFISRGATLVFADSSKTHPNIGINQIEKLITKKTKAIVLVHYAGIACDMDPIVELCKQKKIMIIEDAAQGIHAKYKNRPLGSIGNMGTLSFHETKNIISGEGGLWIGNDENFFERASILRDKGTNRKAFYEGQVEKYEWVDLGSSHLPSEIISAYLYAQLMNVEKITNSRVRKWNKYYKQLKMLENFGVSLPFIPEYSSNNGHIFYLVLDSFEVRSQLIIYLKDKKILPTFHYQSLHKSKFYQKNNSLLSLPYSDLYSERLIRLPLYHDMIDQQIDYVIENTIDFFKKNI